MQASIQEHKIAVTVLAALSSPKQLPFIRLQLQQFHSHFAVLFHLSAIIYQMSFPSIHDAYGGFGERSIIPANSKENTPSTQELAEPAKREGQGKDSGRYPSDAMRCPKCNNVCMTRMNSEMGAAAWVWCVLLAPFACAGISCLCFESCRDKIHYCTRCGNIVGKKFAKVC